MCFHREVFCHALLLPVILSAAKNLGPPREILRCAQNDSETVMVPKNLPVKGPSTRARWGGYPGM